MTPYLELYFLQLESYLESKDELPPLAETYRGACKALSVGEGESLHGCEDSRIDCI